MAERGYEDGDDVISYNFAPSQLLRLDFDENGLTVAAKVTGRQVNRDGTLEPGRWQRAEAETGKDPKAEGNAGAR
ncbi:unnamed protein product [marine sediment metagenome]|uniref:Uncharacterized protein n=1 Tax=marine sediment metagenome TaxID=412755 RepID=X1Q5E8_9ZZZZ